VTGETVRRERRWTSAGEIPARELVRSARPDDHCRRNPIPLTVRVLSGIVWLRTVILHCNGNDRMIVSCEVHDGNLRQRHPYC
jgi:hypothetical protein